MKCFTFEFLRVVHQAGGIDYVGPFPLESILKNHHIFMIFILKSSYVKYSVCTTHSHTDLCML